MAHKRYQNNSLMLRDMVAIYAHWGAVILAVGFYLMHQWLPGSVLLAAALLAVPVVRLFRRGRP